MLLPKVVKTKTWLWCVSNFCQWLSPWIVSWTEADSARYRTLFVVPMNTWILSFSAHLKNPQMLLSCIFILISILFLFFNFVLFFVFVFVFSKEKCFSPSTVDFRSLAMIHLYMTNEKARLKLAVKITSQIDADRLWHLSGLVTFKHGRKCDKNTFCWLIEGW